MKLSQINYDFNEAKEFEIKDPETGLSFEKPAFITILSIESDVGQKIKLDIFREAAELIEKKQERSEESTIKHLAKLIVSYRGIEDEKGKELKVTEENTLKLLQSPIIYKMVNNESATLGNYRKA